MSKKDKDVLNTDTLDESFDDALVGLRKSLGLDEVTEPLTKAHSKKKSKSSEMKGDAETSDDDDDDYEEGDMDDDDEGYEETKKSLEASLSDEPEAEAAMDVEPFLRELVKGIDAKFVALDKSLSDRFDSAESLNKAQSLMLIAQASLQKSIQTTTEKIGNSAVASNSLRVKQGDRFAKSADTDVEDMLRKVDTTKWIDENKIDINQATLIDNRMNKGSLFKSMDAVDQMVKSLVAEGAK